MFLQRVGGIECGGWDAGMAALSARSELRDRLFKVLVDVPEVR
jgi:hypothetical protein